MLEQITVGLVVSVAFAACVWKLMPARRRLKVLLALDSWAARHTALSAFRERRIKPRIARAAGAGCAGCAANVGIRSNHPPR
jgi:hypothetical protein